LEGRPDDDLVLERALPVGKFDSGCRLTFRGGSSLCVPCAKSEKQDARLQIETASTKPLPAYILAASLVAVLTTYSKQAKNKGLSV
jgi:hypothetical protein